MKLASKVKPIRILEKNQPTFKNFEKYPRRRSRDDYRFRFDFRQLHPFVNFEKIIERECAKITAMLQTRCSFILLYGLIHFSKLKPVVFNGKFLQKNQKFQRIHSFDSTRKKIWPKVEACIISKVWIPDSVESVILTIFLHRLISDMIWAVA